MFLPAAFHLCALIYKRQCCLEARTGVRQPRQLRTRHTIMAEVGPRRGVHAQPITMLTVHLKVLMRIEFRG